jgi:hypothetical protein
VPEKALSCNVETESIGMAVRCERAYSGNAPATPRHRRRTAGRGRRPGCAAATSPCRYRPSTQSAPSRPRHPRQTPWREGRTRRCRRGSAAAGGRTRRPRDSAALDGGGEIGRQALELPPELREHEQRLPRSGRRPRRWDRPGGALARRAAGEGLTRMEEANRKKRTTGINVTSARSIIFTKTSILQPMKTGL